MKPRSVAVILGAALAVLPVSSTLSQTRARGEPAARPVAPMSADEAFAAARQAAIQQNAPDRFEQFAARAGDHPLRSYLDYWRLRLRIAEGRPDAEGGADADIRQFLSRHAGTLVADLMRRDWLINLGRRGDWANFDAQYTQYVVRDEPAVACHALLSRHLKGEAVAAEARALLLAPRELGDGCGRAFDALVTDRVLGQPDVQARLRLAVELDATRGVRRLTRLLADPPDVLLVDAAVERPVAALNNPAVRASRELSMIALSRLARTDPVAAAGMLAADRSLASADRAFVFSQAAAAAQRRLLPVAVDYVRQSAGSNASDETLAWHVRAALQARDWKLLRAVIDQMSETGQRDPAWTYWMARAHQADGRTQEAEALWKRIAGPQHFYAQLAAEELGLLPALPPRAAAPSPEDIAEAGRNPGFERAKQFYRAGLRFEGNREWLFTLRGLSDRQLLAAAEWARRENLLDRTVTTAERTREEHDYTLRFPTPYREQMLAAAQQQGVDPAWVYGLIRQESRFIVDARSGVGAQGLMQIMPSTAKWIAARLGVRDWRIHDIDTNLAFGTFYLRRVQDDLGGSPLLASAAYNAGPGRPRNWRAQLPQPIDGAAFAEIVPFNETRDYVKKVLSNAVIYGQLFTGRPQSLKERLGVVSPTAAGRTELP